MQEVTQNIKKRSLAALVATRTHGMEVINTARAGKLVERRPKVMTNVSKTSQTFMTQIMQASFVELHDIALSGISKGFMVAFVERLPIVRADGAMEGVLGVSERTLYRYKTDANALLSPDTASKLVDFAQVMQKATSVMGDTEAAQRWLTTPAFDFNRRRPIDLMVTHQGSQAVLTLLGQIEYGVYP